MSRWLYAIEISDLPAGAVTSVQVGGRWLALCNDAGRFYAVAHDCPHEGGPLGRGRLADGCIVCPVHHWPFDLKTGLSDPNLPTVHLTFFACRVRDGKLYVDPAAPIPPQKLDLPG